MTAVEAHPPIRQLVKIRRRNGTDHPLLFGGFCRLGQDIGLGHTFSPVYMAVLQRTLVTEAAMQRLTTELAFVRALNGLVMEDVSIPMDEGRFNGEAGRIVSEYSSDFSFEPLVNNFIGLRLATGDEAEIFYAALAGVGKVFSRTNLLVGMQLVGFGHVIAQAGIDMTTLALEHLQQVLSVCGGNLTDFNAGLVSDEKGLLSDGVQRVQVVGSGDVQALTHSGEKITLSRLSWLRLPLPTD